MIAFRLKIDFSILYPIYFIDTCLENHNQWNDLL